MRLYRVTFNVCLTRGPVALSVVLAPHEPLKPRIFDAPGTRTPIVRC